MLRPADVLPLVVYSIYTEQSNALCSVDHHVTLKTSRMLIPIQPRWNTPRHKNTWSSVSLSITLNGFSSREYTNETNKLILNPSPDTHVASLTFGDNDGWRRVCNLDNPEPAHHTTPGTASLINTVDTKSSQDSSAGGSVGRDMVCHVNTAYRAPFGTHCESVIGHHQWECPPRGWWMHQLQLPSAPGADTLPAWNTLSRWAKQTMFQMEKLSYWKFKLNAAVPSALLGHFTQQHDAKHFPDTIRQEAPTGLEL